MHRRQLNWIPLILIAAVLFSACGATQAEDVAPAPQEPAEEPIPADEETSTEAALPEEPTSILTVDALGRELQFDTVPEHIVITGKANWLIGHTLYLFPEADGRVLAWEERGGNTSDFLAAISPSFADVITLAQGASAEQIAPLQPDLVIMKSYLRENLGSPMEEIGLDVFYANLETPDQFYAEIEQIGAMLANPGHAAEIINFYRERVEMIETRVSDLDETERPSVLVIQRTATGEDVAFTVPPMTWMQTLEVTTAGGAPVWEEVTGNGWTTITFEQIAAWDPDVVLVIAFRGDPDALVAELESSPEWQALRATQEGQVYAFPADFRGWDLPDPRWILGTTWVAQTLHPDLFSDIDMMNEVYTFYTEMYGLTEDQVETIIVPMLMGDIP